MQEVYSNTSSGELSEKLLYNLFDGVYFVDRERTILYWNPACELSSGYTAAEMIGSHCYDNILDHIDEQGNHLCQDGCPLVESIKTRQKVARKVYLRHKDGHRVAVETHVAPILDETGEPVGAVEVFMDVTAAEELERLRRDFTSMIVHDLRSPITSIKGFAELMADRVLGSISSDQERALSIIKEAIDRQLALVNDYLDFSKIEAGQIRLETQEMDITLPIISALRLVEVQARAKNIFLSSKLEKNLPLVAGDRAKLEQVMTNLLTNAVKFTPQNGSITVAASPALDGSAVEVSVTDTGVGITVDDLPFIFDLYRQARTSKTTSQKGTGLGLTIARLLVEAHGGTIWAESQPDKGSTFHFTVPAAKA